MAATTDGTKAAPLGPAMSKAEAVAYLGVSERSLERLVAARKVRSLKPSRARGGRRQFLRSELDRYLRENNRLAR